jgi:hypothetical protein
MGVYCFVLVIARSNQIACIRHKKDGVYCVKELSYRTPKERHGLYRRYHKSIWSGFPLAITAPFLTAAGRQP